MSCMEAMFRYAHHYSNHSNTFMIAFEAMVGNIFMIASGAVVGWYNTLEEKKINVLIIDIWRHIYVSVN